MDEPIRPKEELFVTVSEASRILGVSKRTIHNWLERGTLKFWKTPGGHVRIPETSVNALLEDRHRQMELQERQSACSILIVEDDPIVIDYYETSMNHWNLPIRLNIAENGFQGLIQLVKERPDLIVTDLRMQGMDGFELIRNLQMRDDLKDIRIVVISVLQPHEIQEKGGLPAGIPVFGKPPPLEQIRKIVMEILRSRNRRMLRFSGTE